MDEEKQFRTDKRLDRAIREHMDPRKRNTREMQRLHDTIKRRLDEAAKRLDK